MAFLFLVKYVAAMHTIATNAIIVLTLQIIRSRLQPKGSYVWNHPPGGLYFHPKFSTSPLDYPFFRDYPRLAQMDNNVITRSPTNYTAVISCTKPILRESAPVVKLVKAISTAAHLERIVIVWMGSGSPRFKIPKLAIPVSVVTESGSDKWTRQFWPNTDIQTEAVLHLSEDVEMTSDEV